MSTESGEFDLQPDPRILPMLGEINLAHWRCLAELVDNAIDGFLSVMRGGGSLEMPQIDIEVPTRDEEKSRVTVSDNGPGMAPERLEMAVRAGWSGNNPVDSLGMFGMGFNIATARLGTVTTVWTSRLGDEEEHGLRIDFDELRRQRHFRTPRLTQPKTLPGTSGTRVVIERLKPEQRAWFAKPGNRSNIKRELARAYSAMLRENGVPLTFTLMLGGRKVCAVNHCVWGEDRSVETSRHGTVDAVQKIDRKLPDRPFCLSCWQWLPARESACPTCEGGGDLVERKRHVHGWIGLQRYLSSTDYGIDFIRNGRKIEIQNRELFSWKDANTGGEELEYPIDDPRARGRFVGEIHLDHCRVTYMKDRFDRTDPAWDEAVMIVRGDGPLQPQKAAHQGFVQNESPLFKLYQAFRRSSPPKARVAGEWAKVLVVKDNDRAVEMAKRFQEGDPAYQTDEKWWELVEEEDNRLLTPSGAGSGTATGGGGGASGGSGLSGFGAGGSTQSGGGTSTQTGSPVQQPFWPQKAIPSLTREYIHDHTSIRWDIRAFAVQSGDPDLGGDSVPWSLSKQADGTARFLINRDHDIFRSATMTDLDALLCEIAYKIADFTRGQADALPFPRILADLRERYAGALKLDAVALSNGAEMLFRSIARAWCRDIESDDATTLFAAMPSGHCEEIHKRMAARAISNPQQTISEGRFLEYAPARAIVEFVIEHPDLFFDGRCWEDAYSDLDYLHPAATEEARKAVLKYHEALLLDLLWLSEQDPDDLAIAPRERVVRSALALNLLTPSPVNGNDADA